MRHGHLSASVSILVAYLVMLPVAPAQTSVFSDTFDSGTPGGVVSGISWPFVDNAGYPTSVPGKVVSCRMHQIQGSLPGHAKNHTASPDVGGSAFQVDANPYPYAAYHEFDPQTNILRAGVWVWDDVESRKPQNWPNPAQINGGLTLTTLPDATPIIMHNGITEIYTYGDWAFLGIQALIPSAKLDPNSPTFNPYDTAVATQYCYQWYTKTDGWHLTLDPNTTNPVPRRADFRIPEQIPQSWRHLEILIKPYTGQVGDVEFYVDGTLVGSGRRAPGVGSGAEFRRLQIGARFPEVSDANAFRATYSYEHLWYDDVTLATELPPVICANPDLRFDADGDGDVDMDDFAVFQGCDHLGLAPLTAACRCMNVDGNSVIDTADLDAFTACASGPAVPADITCDDALPPP